MYARPWSRRKEKRMLELKYIGEETRYNVEFGRISPHVIQLLGEVPFKDSGFVLSRAGKNDWWDYPGYTTLYREISGVYQLSDDGSVYTAPPEPLPPQEPEPYVPTLEEVKAAKKQEIYMMYNADVAAGINVELSTGTQHFPLSDEDQRFLMGKQLELSGSDAEMVSYQDSDNHCMLLSRDDMQKIINTALTYVNIKTTYRNNLCEWAGQCSTKEEVGQITYGADIPEEYRNEVYKMYLAQQGA